MHLSNISKMNSAFEGLARKRFYRRARQGVIAMAFLLLSGAYMQASEPVLDVWPTGPHTRQDCVYAVTTALNNVQRWHSDELSQLQAVHLQKAWRFEDVAYERKRVARENLDAQVELIESRYQLLMLQIYLVELGCNRLLRVPRAACELSVESSKEAVERSKDNAKEAAENEYLNNIAIIDQLLERQIRRNSEEFQTQQRRLKSMKTYWENVVNKIYGNCLESAN